jgi:hypothetical protein
MTAYVAARPNALPVSTNSHMRAATAKLTPLVEERGKPCATVDRQPRGPFSGALAAHGCSSSKAWSGAARSFRDSDESAAGAMGRDLLLPPHFRNRKEDPFDAAVVCHQTH